MCCNPLINEQFVIKRLVEKNKALSQELRVARKHGTTGGETPDDSTGGATPNTYTFKVCIDHDENNVIDTGIRGQLVRDWQIDDDTLDVIIEAVKDKDVKYIEYAVSRARIIDDSVIVIGLTKLSDFSAIPELTYEYNYDGVACKMNPNDISFDSIYKAPVMGIIDLTNAFKVPYTVPIYESNTTATLNDNIDIRYWKNMPRIIGSGTTRYLSINPINGGKFTIDPNRDYTGEIGVINLSYATDYNWYFYASGRYTEDERALLIITCNAIIDKLILNSNLKNKYPCSNKPLHVGSKLFSHYSPSYNITINNLQSSQEIYDILNMDEGTTINNFIKVGGD